MRQSVKYKLDKVLSKMNHNTLEARRRKMKNKDRDYTQWFKTGEFEFTPARFTVPVLEAGIYSVDRDPRSDQITFKKELDISEDIINFPGSQGETIFNDIKTFWGLKTKYDKIGQPFKRGFLLHGVPGGGKTSLIKLIIADTVKSGGIALKFKNPYDFEEAMKLLRQVEENRAVLVLMEDIDSIIDQHSESEVLNCLDGILSHGSTVFIATTNYPEKLLGRLTNRPSRFDRVFAFSPPDKKMRKMYIEKLFKSSNKDIKESVINKWIEDTDTLTIAHIKELFLSTELFNANYDTTLEILKGMRETVKPYEEAGKSKVGF